MIAAPATAAAALNVPVAAAIVTVPALVAPILILVALFNVVAEVTLVALPYKIIFTVLTFLSQSSSKGLFPLP